MTELQKAVFSVFREFVRVCDKLGLSYYLVCGSALGAVKYNGFIPWDDDIDVAMTRKEYSVFCEKAQKYLPENLFLQTYKTDSAFPCIYAKLRNSETTFLENGVSNLPINHGIYIDIFPLDGYPENKEDREKLERGKRKLKLRLTCAFRFTDTQSFRAKAYLSFLRLSGWHKKTVKTAERLERLISRTNTEDSAIWCNHGNWQRQLEYAEKEQYGNGTTAEFEGMTVRIPERYDEYLTQKYGDWRSDLPPEKKKSHHECLVCDLKRPYTDYIKQ